MALEGFRSSGMNDYTKMTLERALAPFTQRLQHDKRHSTHAPAGLLSNHGNKYKHTLSLSHRQSRQERKAAMA